MAEISRKISASFSAKGYYRRDPEENWSLREDVAGYEYPGEGDHYRIGITREVIQNSEDIAPLFDILYAPFNEFITRNMARAVIAKTLLQHPPQHLRSLLTTDLEATISLEDSGNRDLTDCYQIIFGRNHPSRQTSPDMVAREVAEAERIFAEARKREPQPDFRDQFKALYSLERITNESAPELLLDYDVLAKATFGCVLEDLGFSLDDTLCIGAMIKQNGQPVLVGGCFAWRDITYLKRNGRDVTLDAYEISGAVIRKEYRGKGIYKGMTLALLQSLAQRPEPIDVVFSFSNIQEHATMAVAAQTGRILVTETARDLHLTIKPALQQNRIEGRYVDDIVTYLPGEQLRRLYGTDERESV